MPVGKLFLLAGAWPDFTKICLVMRFGAVAGISEMKAFIDSTRVFNTVSCRKVNLPCVKDILHAPRTWDVVQTTLPHK